MNLALRAACAGDRGDFPRTLPLLSLSNEQGIPLLCVTGREPLVHVRIWPWMTELRGTFKFPKRGWSRLTDNRGGKHHLAQRNQGGLHGGRNI